MSKIKKNIDYIILSSIILVIATTCRPDECFKGAGVEGSKYVETGYFREVNVNGIFEVIMVQDTANFIIFEGGENMLGQASAVNTDSVLWIDNTNSCYYLKDYEKVKVFLHFNNLAAINLKEPSTVRSLKPITNIFTMTVQGQVADIDIELNNEHFFFYNHKTSGGKYIFRGSCTNCSIMGFYAGQVDASKLNTNTMYIENHSVTDYYVRADNAVHAEIYNNGNIYVYGKPEIYIDSLKGSGRVIEMN